MDFVVTDPKGENSILHFARPLDCFRPVDKIKVEYPKGYMLGKAYVKKLLRCIRKDVMHINDCEGNELMTIQASETDLRDLTISDNRGKAIGSMTALYEFESLITTFSGGYVLRVTFPKELPLAHKIMLLAACMIVVHVDFHNDFIAPYSVDRRGLFRRGSNKIDPFVGPYERYQYLQLFNTPV